MATVLHQDPENWKKEMELLWRQLPKPYRNEHSVRRTLQCFLYGRLREAGYQVIADYMPPRISDRPIDLIALDDQMEIVLAVCLDSLVTLAAVKSLGSFECHRKIIFTMSIAEKKVQESRFFLKPDIEHIHLQSPVKVF
ncbi:MAG: hypothetical protein GX443_08865 [Deltaproteobacteria bacterium]|nr:hypothetical protein [Deltaproteobacteria bacterium]